MDFLLALIELFSLGVTVEALRAIMGSKSAILVQRWPVEPKFQVEGVTPTNHFSSQKTRLNVLSYGIQIWTDLSTILSQFTRVTDRQTDRQTDGQTEFSSQYRVCITCSAVKIWTDLSSILSQITCLTDGRTDGQTEFSSLVRVSIPCSAVKRTGVGRPSHASCNAFAIATFSSWAIFRCRQYEFIFKLQPR